MRCVLFALLVLAGCASDAAQPPTAASQRPLQLNPVVTQANIATTICKPGFTATIRPPVSYTSKIKRDMAAAAHVNVADVVLDHIVPLEVGGAPANPANFMLQPRAESYVKDRVENAVNHLVCSGRLTLAQGQHCFIVDWRTCPKEDT